MAGPFKTCFDNVPSKRRHISRRDKVERKSRFYCAWFKGHPRERWLVTWTGTPPGLRHLPERSSPLAPSARATSGTDLQDGARESNVGRGRIAAELLLKLGIRVSPRTVRRYMPLNTGPRNRLPSQPWMTFVRNHAQAILASDFFVVVTARF